VLTQDESTGGLEVHEVTDEIVIEAAALLDVTLHHQDGAVEVIRTTDEHPFWVESPLVIGRKSGPTGWRRADGLRPGEQVRTLTGTAFIESLSFTGERQTVYNLTVDGQPNYHVGPDGVLVHNCGYDVDAFFAAATALDRNGLTYMARALQKHSARSGSPWRRVGTTLSDLNAEGDRWAMEVLTNPGTKVKGARDGRTDFVLPDGRGMRFNADGSFYSLLTVTHN